MNTMSVFQCSNCQLALETSESGELVCSGCRKNFYDQDKKRLDFLGDVGRQKPSTRAQVLMEHPTVVKWYERVVRVNSVWMFSGSKAPTRDNEFFIYNNALGVDYFDGPWVDLSCGDGRLSIQVAKNKPADKVIGLDYSPAMLDKATEDGKDCKNLTFSLGDTHHLPFCDNSIQGIVNVGALHIYDDPEQALREVLRVLKPGGVYVCSDFAKSKRLLAYFAEWFSQIKRFDTGELPGWLESLGFVNFQQTVFGSAFFFKAYKPLE